MFVDYISLMLINMVAGFLILAYFVYAGLAAEDRSQWAPAFAAVAFVGLATGLHMALTWPIPKLAKVNLNFANIAYGEMTVLLGALFFAAALACAKGWRFDAIAIYAAVAGAAAIVVGVQFWRLGLSNAPHLTSIGFIVSGACGILFCPLVWSWKKSAGARMAVAILMTVAALIWAVIGYMAYWAHIAHFSQLR